MKEYTEYTEYAESRRGRGEQSESDLDDFGHRAFGVPSRRDAPKYSRFNPPISRTKPRETASPAVAPTTRRNRP